MNDKIEAGNAIRARIEAERDLYFIKRGEVTTIAEALGASEMYSGSVEATLIGCISIDWLIKFADAIKLKNQTISEERYIAVRTMLLAPDNFDGLFKDDAEGFLEPTNTEGFDALADKMAAEIKSKKGAL